MGGSIDFECPLEGGAVFRVRLPLSTPPREPADFATTGMDDLLV